jgi:hypothetical protein
MGRLAVKNSSVVASDILQDYSGKKIAISLIRSKSFSQPESKRLHHLAAIMPPQTE